MNVKDIVAKYQSQRKLFTYQDYLALPDDGNRYEVINGELIMVAAPYTIHQIVSGNLEYEMRGFVNHTRIGRILDAPVDVVFDENNVLQPDIIFIAKENYAIITEKNIQGPPDLVVEILSPSTGYYDLFDKKEIYEKYGVKEYWIIDPVRQWIEIFIHSGANLESWKRIEKKGKIQSRILAGFEIESEKIFSIDG